MLDSLYLTNILLSLILIVLVMANWETLFQHATLVGNIALLLLYGGCIVLIVIAIWNEVEGSTAAELKDNATQRLVMTAEVGAGIILWLLTMLFATRPVAWIRKRLFSEARDTDTENISHPLFVKKDVVIATVFLCLYAIGFYLLLAPEKVVWPDWLMFEVPSFFLTIYCFFWLVGWSITSFTRDLFRKAPKEKTKNPEEERERKAKNKELWEKHE